MLGAIIGDMVGSIFEKNPIKRKDFNIFNPAMRTTDDSLLTLDVASTLIDHYPIQYGEDSLKTIKRDLVKRFIRTVRSNPSAGFGGYFHQWCKSNYDIENPEPYGSFGNGSAMRISPVGWIANTEEEVKVLSRTVTEVTHNHPEGIKGAEAIALCIFMALHGSTKEEIKNRMIKEYYPIIATLDFDDLVKNYTFDVTCEGSVPQAIYCFLISESLEDTIRNCVAIGGDCDTTGAMAGAIAEAFYNKEELSNFEKRYLYWLVDPEAEIIIKSFHKTIGSRKFQKK